MQVLKYLLVMSCMLFSQTVYAGDIKSMYKTSCLPEMKEFRADVQDFFVDSENWDWKRKTKNYGLYELNVKTTVEKPQPHEESCVIDGVEYKMKFTSVFVRPYYKDYKMAVQLFAGKKYLGILFPFGSEYDGIYNSVGIKNGKIFVDGCAFEGANQSDCKYDYKELDMPQETSYELSLAEKSPVVASDFNVVELNCYENLETAYVNLRFYNEGSRLPENYYWLKDNPLIKCGDVSMKFSADGEVNVYNNKKKFNNFNIGNCKKQVFRITFNPVKFYSFDVVYFDKKELYRQGKKCFENEACQLCDK